MEQILKENRELWDLFEMISLIRDRDEAARFFRDLCTPRELEAMAERLEVAGLLREGLSYRRISEVTGASTTTVTRIAHWCKHGEGGYQTMLQRGRRSSKKC